MGSTTAPIVIFTAACLWPPPPETTAEAVTSPTLHRDGDVFLLDLGRDENLWTPAYTEGLLAALDEVAATPDPRALVTMAEGKHFSAGLDTDLLASADPPEAGRLSRLFLTALDRMLHLPVLTVAAIQGHAFGAGALLAICHDARVMREDRGFWCTPEVDLGMGFTPGLATLLRSKLNPSTVHRAMLTGERFGGRAAVQAGIADQAVPADAVLPVALELARPLAAKAGATVGEIKANLFGEVHAGLIADLAAFEVSPPLTDPRI